MSGPYDRPDDPDEVTLWSGRLRPWPAAPVPEGDLDDETVRSGGADLDDDTVVSGRFAHDDTVRSARPEVDDDTVVSRSVRIDPGAAPTDVDPVDADDPADAWTTTAPRRPLASILDVDEVTRRRPAPVPDVDEVTRRRPASVPEVDEVTRRRPAPGPDVDEVTRRRPAPAATPAPTPDVDEATRRRHVAPDLDLDDTTAPGVRARSAIPDAVSPTTPPAPDLDDQTASGARRRAARAADGAAGGAAAPDRAAPDREAPARTSPARIAADREVPGTVRAAHIPIAGEQQAYAPRTGEPVRVERRPSASAVRSEADVPASRRRTGRRGALRALILAGVIVVLLGVAVAAAVLLLG
ncbi:hypothetical protein IFU08_03345 [Microbacterium sp. CFBP 8790]|uniref:hypothetical protein n=1 Tax=unclassified Microbacterium TaxID=2609290 RepID=UPI0017859A8C|nr:MULTISPECIES: hypothetical protein [unclassified Microbacterium]MBD8207639.1 hypothetical protein [Microbacterium sp. CFBP 8801]MBD8508602.1 hypothetical protein [Microbacterium sp. CFBP 8790]